MPKRSLHSLSLQHRVQGIAPRLAQPSTVGAIEPDFCAPLSIGGHMQTHPPTESQSTGTRTIGCITQCYYKTIHYMYTYLPIVVVVGTAVCFLRAVSGTANQMLAIFNAGRTVDGTSSLFAHTRLQGACVIVFQTYSP